jgi:hypothetical protein
MLYRASDLDGFFGTTNVTENGMLKEFLWGRFTENRSKRIGKVEL